VNKNPEYYTTKEALKILREKGINISKVTLISWVKKHKLGIQPGGFRANRFIQKNFFHEFMKKIEKDFFDNV